jgi:hypothetical protein
MLWNLEYPLHHRLADLIFIKIWKIFNIDQCSSPRVWDLLSQPYKSTGRIMFYILSALEINNTVFPNRRKFSEQIGPACRHRPNNVILYPTYISRSTVRLLSKYKHTIYTKYKRRTLRLSELLFTYHVMSCHKI